jgi:hypothetical protein
VEIFFHPQLRHSRIVDRLSEKGAIDDGANDRVEQFRIESLADLGARLVEVVGESW